MAKKNTFSFEISIMIVIIKVMIIRETTQISNLTLINHRDINTSLIASKINLIQFGSQDQAFYVSYLGTDSIQRLRQYPYKSQNGQQNNIFKRQYVPTYQTDIKNRIIQVDGKYLIIYSNLSPNIDLFKYGDGTLVLSHTFDFKILQILYSKSNNMLIMLLQFGHMMSILLDQLVAQNYSKFYQFGWADDILINAQISPNQKYLVVGTSSRSNLYLYSMTDLKLLRVSVFSDANSNILMWNKDSSLVYVWGSTIGYLYEWDIKGGQITFTGNLISPLAINLHGMFYISQSNQIQLIYSSKIQFQQPTLMFLSYSLVTKNYASTVNQTHNMTEIQDAGVQYNKDLKKVLIKLRSNTSYRLYTASLESFSIDSSQNLTSATNFSDTSLNNNYGSINLNGSDTAKNISNLSFQQNNTKIDLNSTDNINDSITNNSKNFSLSNQLYKNNSININSTQLLLQESAQAQITPNFVQTFQSFINDTFNSTLVNYTNQLPASRKLFQPIFNFFSNFDDLWLYSYHKRNYQTILNLTFSTIQKVENKKLSTINQLFYFDLSAAKSYLNSQKLSYTSKKFVNIQGNSNGYILNTSNIYSQGLFFLLIVFCFGKVIYRLFDFFNLKIKKIFQHFSFNLYFIIIFLEGNVQYIFYLLGFENKTLFFTNYNFKGIAVLNILIQFAFVIVVVSLYHLIKYSYEDKSRIILDNCNPTYYGILYLTLQLGIKNMALGFTHIFFQNSYSLLILSLILLQIAFLIINLSFSRLKNCQCIVKKSKQWILIFTTFARIILILTFFIEQNVQIQEDIVPMSKLSQFYSVVIQSYMILWYVSIVIETYILISQFYLIMKGVTSLQQINKIGNICLVNVGHLNQDQNNPQKLRASDLRITQTFSDSKLHHFLNMQTNLPIERFQIKKKKKQKLNKRIKYSNFVVKHLNKKKLRFSTKSTLDNAEIYQNQIYHHRKNLQKCYSVKKVMHFTNS